MNNEHNTIITTIPPILQMITTPLTHNDTHTMTTDKTSKLAYLKEKKQIWQWWQKKMKRTSTRAWKEEQHKEYKEILHTLQAPNLAYKQLPHQFYSTQTANTTQTKNHSSTPHRSWYEICKHHTPRLSISNKRTNENPIQTRKSALSITIRQSHTKPRRTTKTTNDPKQTQPW